MAAVRQSIGVALLLALAGWSLHVPRERVSLLNDRLSYAAQALSLAQGQGNTVPMGDERLPGIYPAGVPFLASLAVRVLGPDLRHGAWAILACSLACLAWMVRMGAGLWRPWAGITALLLLWASPVFRATGYDLLSQVPTALAIGLSAWWFASGRSPRALFAAGLVAVLSLLLRWSNVTWPLALGLAELLLGSKRPGSRMRSLGALGGGMALGAAAVLAHNAWANGHPLSTGYPLWGFEVGPRFGLESLTDFAERSMGVDWPLLSSWVGLGRLYAVPVFLAAVWGAWRCWRDRRQEPVPGRLALLTVVALVLQYGFLCLYYYKSDLYLMPTVPLVLLMAVAGVRGVRAASWLAPTLAALLLVLSLTRPQRESPTVLASLARYAELEAAGQLLEPDAVLLTAGDPPLVEALFRTGPGRSVLYLGPHVSPRQASVALAELQAPEETPQAVVAYVRRRHGQGRPVYLDTDPPRFDPETHRALFRVLRTSFTRQPSDVPRVLRLLPRPTGQGPQGH